MAFNLQKVLRALLFSSNQPLSVKDVQDIFARFHEQAPAAVETDDEAAPPLTVPVGDAENAAAAEEAIAPEPGLPTEPAEEIPPADPEAPSLKPPELLDAAAASASAEAASEVAPASQTLADGAAEVAMQAPGDTDAELYQDVPTLITAVQIRETMDAIAAELSAANDVYMLIEGPTGFRIVTHPRFARWIRIMRDEPPPVKLSQSALETLAVVAYRQPVTRSEIESIRGVSAEAGLNKLMERELVYITGRADLPGRPLQYGTTDKFLEFVGAKSLVDLPASDVLTPRQIDAWLQNAVNVTPPADADMGLPLEEGEGDSPNLASVTVEHSVPPFEAGEAAAAATETPGETPAPAEESASPAQSVPDSQPAQTEPAPDENPPEKTE